MPVFSEPVEIADGSVGPGLQERIQEALRRG
jgi:hypothetical protein